MNAGRPAHALLVPSTFDLPKNYWIAAAYVASARTSINDSIRAPDRDRGRNKNLLADIAGVIGELVAAAAAEEIPGVLEVKTNLLDVDGPIDDVDLTLTDSPTADCVRLEAKCHLLSDRKRLFLINERAHQKASERGAHGYLPTFSGELKALCFLGKVIPISTVDQWGKSTAFRDTARQLCLETFASQWLEVSLPDARERVTGSESVATSTQLDEARNRATTDVRENSLAGYELKQMATREAVDQIAWYAERS